MTVTVVLTFHSTNKSMWGKKKNSVKKEKEHNRKRSRDLKKR